MSHFLLAISVLALASIAWARATLPADGFVAGRNVSLLAIAHRAARPRADRLGRVLDRVRAALGRRRHPPRRQPARHDLRARPRRDLVRGRGRDPADRPVAPRAAPCSASASSRAALLDPAAAAGLHRRVPVAQPAALGRRAGPRLSGGARLDHDRLPRDARRRPARRSERRCGRRRAPRPAEVSTTRTGRAQRATSRSSASKKRASSPSCLPRAAAGRRARSPRRVSAYTLQRPGSTLQRQRPSASRSTCISRRGRLRDRVRAGPRRSCGSPRRSSRPSSASTPRPSSAGRLQRVHRPPAHGRARPRSG